MRGSSVVLICLFTSVVVACGASDAEDEEQGPSRRQSVGALCDAPETCAGCSEVGSVTYAMELMGHIESLDESEARTEFTAMSGQPLEARTGALRRWAAEAGLDGCRLADVLEEVARAPAE